MFATLLLSLVLGQAADAELPAKVARLVRELNANELARRDQAEKSLVELGPPALEHLPKITPNLPPEVRDRLTRIVRAVERTAGASAAAPVPVTLQGTLSLTEALQSLEKQTGNRVADGEREPQRGGSVTIDVKQVPYWEALDRVLDAAGLTLNTFGGQPNALTLQARPDNQRPRFGSADYRGLFRIEATQLESVRDLRSPDLQGLRIGLEVGWEPRVTPIVLAHPLDSLRATDQDGQALTVENAKRTLHANARSDISAVDFVLPFRLPARSSTKIASLRGTLQALLAGRVETFEFAKLKDVKNAELRKAGATVVVERVRKNQEVYEVHVLVRFDAAGEALESHRGWIYENEAFLLDAQGEKIEPAGLEATRQEPDAVGVAYVFPSDVGIETCKFVYKTPALFAKLAVEYELKDLLLP